MDPIAGGPRLSPEATAAATRPSRFYFSGAERQAMSVDQRLALETTINVEGAADPEETARRVGRAQRQRFGEEIARAAAVLIPQGVPAGA